MLEGFGVGELAANAESSSAAAAYADNMRIRADTKGRIISVTIIEQSQKS
jgi:hypothetical protein